MEKEDGLASFEVIGRGGCGEVYKAELPRKIIVIKKIIAAKLSKEDSKRMNQNMCQVRSEIQTVGQLRHHNVLPLLAHLSRCPSLQVVSIKSSPNVTDASIAKMASGCPKLRELDISYCYEVSHESLALIGRSCPDLRSLKRNLMNWLDPSQHVGIVPKEYLNACPQDGDSDAAVIAKFMPHLLHLELRFSKLSAKGLALISEGCLSIDYLDLSGCANVTSRDIANASSNLKNLKNIKKPNFYIPRTMLRSFAGGMSLRSGRRIYFSSKCICSPPLPPGQ